MSSPINPVEEKPVDRANRLARAAQLRQVALSMAVGPVGTKEKPADVVARAAAYFAWLSTDGSATEGAKQP